MISMKNVQAIGETFSSPERIPTTLLKISSFAFFRKKSGFYGPWNHCPNFNIPKNKIKINTKKEKMQEVIENHPQQQSYIVKNIIRDIIYSFPTKNALPYTFELSTLCNISE
jgi:hypothetical protein